MSVSGYVPCFNNRGTILAAVRSLQAQQPALAQVFVVDDGSTDGSVALLRQNGIEVVEMSRNSGRGPVRARAMSHAHHPFVLCCDATNVLPPGFAARALTWFEDPDVAAVFGRITDPHPRTAVARWRARHLFKSGETPAVTHRVPLITFGTMLRASQVAAAGGFALELRHSEDIDLGQRLLAAGLDVVSDPALAVITNIENTLGQVLERYWRWYVGKNEAYGARTYFAGIKFSITDMAARDLRAQDPLAALISLLVPHYQLWRFAKRKLSS